MRHAALVVLVLAASPIASGCLGGSPAKVGTTPGSVRAIAPAAGAVLDAATRGRLLAEYRASRIRISCPSGSRCPQPPPGRFWTGSGLLRVLHRDHPSIAATDDLNATLSLDIRIVFVLPDSTANRLDLATAAADGRYVHLIAVGHGRPRFRFGAL